MREGSNPDDDEDDDETEDETEDDGFAVEYI
jgi:hypothetical protein